MEVVDVDVIFRKEGIVENAIFYGLEEISSSNILIKIFALIKKLVPAFVQFHKLPAMKLHGVMTRYELYTDSQLPLSDNHGNQEPFRP
jgi:KUP system potassium uptake protein